MKEFVTYLLENPNIKNEPVLIGENLVFNFIVRNLNQLEKTLTSPQFFPELKWDIILKELILEIQDRILTIIMPEIQNYVNSIDFKVINKISEGDAIGIEYLKQNMITFLNSVLTNKDFRFNFNSVLNIFKYKILEKYIPAIFQRREFIYNELVKVQRLNLTDIEYINFLKIILLIKNTGYIKLKFDEAGDKINIIEASKSKKLLEIFLKKAVENLKKDLAGFPEKALVIGLKSNLKEEQTELTDAAARFVYILTARFHNYKPYDRIDRGAETPDKSWFNIARKNAELYGYNKRMLEELYRIAGENNW